MRIQTSPKRRVASTLAAAVVIAGMLTASAAAAGGTIYACVKHTSGATRIVGAKSKCRHGEQKLSWASAGQKGLAGAPGPAGAPGAEGKAGANGAAGVFSSVSTPAQSLIEEQLTTAVSEVVPPGSYAVFSRTVLVSKNAKAAFVEAVCELVGQAGTAGTGLQTPIDSASWAGALGEKAPTSFLAEGTLSLQGVYTSAVTSTLELVCFNDGTQGVSVNASQLQALSVARIG